jgi:hypothetical protein
MDGTPVFCGGESANGKEAAHCFKLDKNAKTWLNVSFYCFVYLIN